MRPTGRPQPETRRPSPVPELRLARYAWLPLILLVLCGCSDPPAPTDGKADATAAQAPAAAPTPTPSPDDALFPDPQQNRPVPQGVPNILLISVDTMRADHLGCYGHPDKATPNIDKLAEAGRRYETCIASSPITLPSHATMLTGSYPFVHGARSNVRFRLGDENQTLAELLYEKGYDTWAEVAAAVLNREAGLAQGFERYRGPGGGAAATLERPADEITTAALRHIAQRRTRPFFGLVHYFDPHAPYAAPDAFAERFDDPYLAEIAFVDAQIGRLLAALIQTPHAARTVVILTADHGEGRGQHGEASHSFYVFDTTQRVPLILWGPAWIKPGLATETARLIDLAPTIARLAGLTPTGQMQGADLLAPAEHTDVTAYAETLEPQLAFEYAPLRALWQAGWKYIHAPNPLLFHVAEDPGEERNLATAEPERVAAMQATLRKLIEASPPRIASQAAGASGGDARLRDLAALGYVGGEDEPDPDELDRFEPRGRDPHEAQETIVAFARAVGHLRTGDPSEALARLEGLLEEEPGNVLLLQHYADALAGNARPQEAIETFERVLKLRPTATRARLDLARLYREAGRLADAEAALNKLVEEAPTFAPGYVELAGLLDAQNRFDEAAALLKRGQDRTGHDYALELLIARHLAADKRAPEAVRLIQTLIQREPARFDAYELLASLLAAEGQTEQSLMTLATFHQRYPEVRRAIDPLAQSLLRAGRPVEAAQVWQQSMDKLPPSGRRHLQLAVALRRAGQSDDALVHFRKAVELDDKLPAAWLGIAQITERAGDRDGALAAYKRLMETAPGNPQGYLGQAALRQTAGDSVAAADVLRAGVKRVPQSPRLLEALTWLLATAADESVRSCEEAVAMAERLATVAPPSLSVADTRAAALACGGDYAGALAVLDEALAAPGEVPEDFLAQVRQRRGQYADGRSYVEGVSP